MTASAWTSRPVVAMVPSYNGAAFLADTLASLAAQDHPELRVIMSDDASTDGSWDICEHYAARDSRFRALRQATRLGWVANSNVLLGLAAGHDAFFAPHDDLFESGYVSTLAAALDENPAASLAYSHTVLFGDRESGHEMTAAWTTRPGGPVRRGLRYIVDIDWERWSPFRGLVRAGALRAAGPLRPSPVGEYAADGRWLFRLHLLGPFVRVPRPLCRKRIHDASLHRSPAWFLERRHELDLSEFIPEILAADLNLAQTSALLLGVVGQAALLRLPERVKAAARRPLRLV